MISLKSCLCISQIFIDDKLIPESSTAEDLQHCQSSTDQSSKQMLFIGNGNKSFWECKLNIGNFSFNKNIVNINYNIYLMQIELLVVFLIVIVIAIYALASRLLEHFHIRYLHQSGLGIIIGWFIGMFVYFAYKSELVDFGFSETIFFYGLLPPIIFAGGYNLRKKNFFQYFFYIFLYGVVGTIICFVITVLGTKLLNAANLIIKFNVHGGTRQSIQLSTKNILLFAATISATDSLTALTLVGNKYPKIFSIVFGQGLINDAVAIILFRSVGYLSNQQFKFINALELVGNFFYIFFISMLFGLLFGLLCCIIFKKLSHIINKPVIEVGLIFVFGILSYFSSQLFDFSGVISVLVAGITMAHYNFYNISNTGQIATCVSLQATSFICQAFIYIYLGLNFWTLFTDQNGNQYWWSLSFVFFQIAICMIGRMVNIYLLSAFCYFCNKTSWKVSIPQLNIIWFSGTVRGSVAYALILTLTANSQQQLHQIQIIKSGVLFMVFLTTIFMGGLMVPFISCNIKKLQVSNQNSQGQQLQIRGQSPSRDEKQITGVAQQKQKSKIYRFWHKLDEKYFKPFFINNYQSRKNKIATFKKHMKQFENSQGQHFTSILAATIKMKDWAVSQQIIQQNIQEQNKISDKLIANVQIDKKLIDK